MNPIFPSNELSLYSIKVIFSKMSEKTVPLGGTILFPVKVSISKGK